MSQLRRLSTKEAAHKRALLARTSDDIWMVPDAMSGANFERLLKWKERYIKAHRHYPTGSRISVQAHKHIQWEQACESRTKL